jgi:hypothetical protein
MGRINHQPRKFQAEQSCHALVVNLETLKIESHQLYDRAVGALKENSTHSKQ